MEPGEPLHNNATDVLRKQLAEFNRLDVEARPITNLIEDANREVSRVQTAKGNKTCNVEERELEAQNRRVSCGRRRNGPTSWRRT